MRLFLLATALFASAALAQDPGAAKKKKVIRLDAITVEGRIQKPQAFYILQRSTLPCCASISASRLAASSLPISAITSIPPLGTASSAPVLRA